MLHYRNLSQFQYSPAAGGETQPEGPPDDLEMLGMSDPNLGDVSGFDPSNYDLLQQLPAIGTPTIGVSALAPKKKVPEPAKKTSRRDREHHKKEKRARKASPQESSPGPSVTVSAPELSSTSARGTPQRAAKVQAIVQMKTALAGPSKAAAETFSEEEMLAEEDRRRSQLQSQTSAVILTTKSM